MTLFSVDTLVTPVTEDQAFETFLSALETSGVPARSWRKGGAFRTILRVVARSYSGFTDVMAAFARSGFLDSATDGWLTLLAHFVYGVDRRPATFASGKLLFTNVGGGVYDSSNARAGTVQALWTQGNKVYVTQEDLNLLNPGDTQLVDVVAVELGAGSSVGPGLIDKLQTNLLGVTVTNPESVVGTDAQDDESLRQACRNKIAALSLLGPRGAYLYAINVATRADGSPVNINRVVPVESLTTGRETVYVASPSGAPLASDLDLVRASVEAWARPDTVTAVIAAATPVAFTRTLTVWARHTTGLAAGDVSAAVSAALVTLVAGYDIGGVAKPPSLQGYLFASNIEGTAKAAHPAIFAVDGVGANLPLNAGQVATLATAIVVRFA